ncbi:hypothetical protein JCM11251_003033 [Rhodosporidiobolus azoricus]
MQAQSNQQDWSSFLTEEAFDAVSPASTSAVAHLSSHHNQQPASTPGASTSSGDADSPGVHSDSLSASLSADPSTALTSLTSSPSSSSGPFLPFPRSMDPNGNSGKLPEGLEQLAASWQAHQQALAFHAQAAAAAAAAAQAGQVGMGGDGSAPPSGTTTPLPPPMGGFSYPGGMPPLYLPTPGAFPGQLPPDWIAAANAAQSFPTAPSPAPYTGYPSFPTQLPSSAAPTSPSALPAVPLVGLNHLGHLAPNPVVDPNLYALHMTLEAQARIAAAAVANQQQPGGSPTGSSVPPSSSSAHARSQTGPPGKRSSSYLKAAHGLSIAAHQRSKTASSQHSSPLASPAMLPPLPNMGDISGAYGFPPVPSTSAAPTTHQRPVPPLPPARSASGSAAPSTVSSPQTLSPSPAAYGFPPHLFPYPNPYAAALAGYPSSLAPSPAPLPAYHTSQAPSPHPVVDYDFSSLEQDLDRFSSLGGFASAAAAAMASVSPTSTHPPLPSTSSSTYSATPFARPSDAYNVGGYGGAPTPRIAPEALPSPRVLTDVLADPLFFPAPSSASASAKGSSPAASAGSAAGKSAGFAAAGVLATPSPGNESQASPAGSTVLDEDSLEALNSKDPIAAQVWRMFHKAKNTMPNGARMENLTWRLMSMTLRKRREDSASAVASASASAAPSQAPSPGTEEARTQRALEAALEEQRERNEERDVVQPLTKGPPPAGRMRGAMGRERSDSTGHGRGRSSMGLTAAQEQQLKEEEDKAKEDAEGIEGAEEERGRRRRTKSGTQSKSNSATPEADEIDDMMDWRAMSKSRSRSRAPDMMDWRGASRSRSRAPTSRTSVALPTIDSTPAVGNFSRFFNDSGIPSPINEMPPPPLPSSHTASSSTAPAAVSIAPTDASAPTVAPLAIPLSFNDENAALAELATSLGLSPQDQAQLFGSATARLDGHSLLDFPSPGGSASPLPPLAGLPSPLSASAGLTSPPSASPHPQSFQFPQADAQNGVASGPDPNLAAIENTLNQLISLQSLTSPDQHQDQQPSHSSAVAPPPGPMPILPREATSSSFSTSVKSPLSASYTASTSTGSSATTTTQPPSGQHSRADSLSSSLPASAGKGSLAQQNLQQLISGRKASNVGASTSSASSSRRASASSSSPYLNATTLAQSSRPYSFGAAASVAAAAATSAAPASGLSLNRPAHLPQPDPSSHPSTPYTESPTPHFFPSSAPVQPAHFGSPNPPLFGDGTDTAHLLYDYFHSQHNSAPFLPSPYINGSQLETFGSAPSGGIDPSQLLASFGGGPASAAAAASPYGSEGSPWNVESPVGVGAASPDDDGGKKGKQARRPTAARANSASSIPTTSSGAALKGKGHARSNTISLPSTIQEGKPLEFDSSSASPADSSKGSGSKVAAKKVESDGGPTKCLNCQTTNTPLWRRDSEGRPLCNACGLFRNLHGVDRPANLNTGVIKKRNRKSGPKDPSSKKASSRAAARRNSATALAAGTATSGAVAGSSAQGGAPANSRKERAGAGAPYPNAAARAAQQQQE